MIIHRSWASWSVTPSRTNRTQVARHSVSKANNTHYIISDPVYTGHDTARHDDLLTVNRCTLLWCVQCGQLSLCVCVCKDTDCCVYLSAVRYYLSQSIYLEWCSNSNPILSVFFLFSFHLGSLHIVFLERCTLTPSPPLQEASVLLCFRISDLGNTCETRWLLVQIPFGLWT